MLTTTLVCWLVVEAGSPTRQLTADATAERVATDVLHAALTDTRWYSLVHAICGTAPLTACPLG
eukprot:2923088-Prymnesium_polylepis.2